MNQGASPAGAREGRTTMWFAIALLIVAILLGVAGQIFLKAGVSSLGKNPGVGAVLLSVVKNWKVFAGLACYGVSSLLYLIAISRLDLSYAYPMIAFSYVMVTVLAWRMLGEVVPMGRVVGLVIICIGVLVVAGTYRGAEAEGAKPAASRPAPPAAPPGPD
jgi:drug/metabolite transporter (DMT)-like permease